MWQLYCAEIISYEIYSVATKQVEHCFCFHSNKTLYGLQLALGTYKLTSQGFVF